MNYNDENPPGSSGLKLMLKEVRVDVERISLSHRVLTPEDPVPGRRVSLIRTSTKSYSYRIIKSHNFEKIHSLVVLDKCSTCEERFGTKNCRRGEKWLVRRKQHKK